jgi:hypothetical protein
MKVCSAILISLTCLGARAAATELQNGSPTSSNPNVCMDVSGAQASAGAHVQLWRCHGGLNQLFSLLPNQQFKLNNGTTAPGVEIFAAGGAFCLDAAGSGTTSQTTIGIWDCNNTGAQAWMYLGATGQIVNINSNLCLDNPSGQTNQQLVLNTCSSTHSQIWFIGGS